MIREFLTESGRVNSSKVKESWLIQNRPELVEQLNALYPSEIRMVERLWLLANNVSSRPVCIECGSPNVGFKGLLNGYAEFCSSTCSNRSDQTVKLKKAAYIEKYGVENPFAAERVKQKIAETNTSRYGTDNFAKTETYKARAIATNLEKYGTDWALSTGSKVRQDINDRNRKDFEALCMEGGISILNWSNTKFGIVQATCRESHTFELNKWQIYQRIKYSKTEACPICNPFGSFASTSIEQQICDWLDEAGILYERGCRTLVLNREIDIWIPSAGIGIEVNGVYWHSDSFKETGYHLQKTQEMEKLGFKLLHVWEDLLVNRPDLVKSIILSKLGKYRERLFARKCKVVKILPATSREFIELNHLQGSISAGLHIGLMHGEELIAVATFGKLRKAVGHKGKLGEWELYRFASKIGTQVVGGASKLIKAFIREVSPTRLISFAMRDLSSGELYTRTGFDRIKETSPSYWYIERNSLSRHHRFNFRKDSLIGSGADPGLTEFEIMNQMPYYRIWDSGQLLFEYQLAV